MEEHGPTFLSSDGRHHIVTTVWRPPSKPPTGAVVFYHGMSGYARMAPVRIFAGECATHNLLVVAWDAPAHGSSTAAGVAPLQIPECEHLLTDARRMVEIARTQLDSKAAPVVLCGFSFGAGVALSIAPDVDPRGVLLLSPMCRNPLSKLGACSTSLAHAYARCWWWKLGLNLPKHVRQLLKDDPLFHHRGPTRTFVKRCLPLYHTSLRAAERVDACAIVVRGEYDELVPAKSARGLAYRFKGNGSGMVVEQAKGHNVMGDPQCVKKYASLCAQMASRSN